MDKTNKKEYTRPLEWYKKNINLVDFMIDVYGFIHAKGSSRNHPKLYHPKEDSTKYIIVKNDLGYYTYFNPMIYHSNNSEIIEQKTGGKTIFDFLQYTHRDSLPNKDTFTLGHCRGILDKYVNGEKYIVPEKSQYTIKKTEIDFKNKDFREILGLKELQDTSFLTNRGIEEEIIKHEYFKDILYNHEFHDEKNNIVYNNIAYLMYNLDEQDAVKAVGLRNNGFSGSLGARSQGICASKNHDKELDILFISETMDDCMSHYQMNKEKLKDISIRYLSTQGSVCSSQIDIIQKIIEVQNPKKVQLGFDNDLAGARFGTQVLGKVYLNNLPLESNLFSNSLCFPSKEGTFGRLEFQFYHKDKEEGINKIAKLKDILRVFNDKFYCISTDGNAYHFACKAINDKVSVAVIKFFDYKEHWEMINDFLLENKFNQNQTISIEKPITKDWNDDLRAFKGVHEKYKIENDKVIVLDKKDTIDTPKGFLNINTNDY